MGLINFEENRQVTESLSIWVYLMFPRDLYIFGRNIRSDSLLFSVSCHEAHDVDLS